VSGFFSCIFLEASVADKSECRQAMVMIHSAAISTNAPVCENNAVALLDVCVLSCAADSSVVDCGVFQCACYVNDL
jgi:hypothetical protein